MAQRQILQLLVIELGFDEQNGEPVQLFFAFFACFAVNAPVKPWLQWL